MDLYDENDFASAAEIPCEFCGQLWPLEIYIEHVTGCRPDLTSSLSFTDYEFEYNAAEPEVGDDSEYDDAVPEYRINQTIGDEFKKWTATLGHKIDTVSSNENKAASESITKEPATVAHQITPIPPVTIKNNYEPKKETVEVQMNNPPNESKQNKQDSIPPDTKKKNEKFEKKNIHSPKKDAFNEMKGETLLSFGNEANVSRISENEPQDNKDQDEAEDVEDISNLSDIDCDETLEEFWNRAKNFLNRQKLYGR